MIQSEYDSKLGKIETGLKLTQLRDLSEWLRQNRARLETSIAAELGAKNDLANIAEDLEIKVVQDLPTEQLPDPFVVERFTTAPGGSTKLHLKRKNELRILPYSEVVESFVLDHRAWITDQMKGVRAALARKSQLQREREAAQDEAEAKAILDEARTIIQNDAHLAPRIQEAIRLASNSYAQRVDKAARLVKLHADTQKAGKSFVAAYVAARRAKKL